jgi:hypothetical protein
VLEGLDVPHPSTTSSTSSTLSTVALYSSTIHVEKVDGTHRRATLPTGQTIDFGVHGPIAEHFRLEPQSLPLPVDYIVASTAG